MSNDYGSNPYAQQPAPQQVPPPPVAPQGPNPYAQNPQAPQAPYPPDPNAQAPYAQNPYGQNPYGQQSPYHQNPYGQNPYGQPQGAPTGEARCRFCGGFPAVRATVRGHQGMIVLMRFMSLKGPFCRDCGIAAHRDMTTKTMWQGWWSYCSWVIAPLTILYNLIPRSKFNKLDKPQTGFRPPMNPGKPIFERPGAFVAILPVALVVVIIIQAARG
ncbi:hypothetical protein [Streptomyces sp. ICBB 8177]|uniref:hypothetical protein n=1 Tax=Streptomyces sp. ICBB 8177 TaxID=563922 RepID=UPI000D672035|nr:hypothetical protein [Streptomyces sp. ICBB 8177]PWI41229.1 hypothetical protein CK485_28290 [Streptomyces sp. ICBB 8177]